jgi:hypothetical protein
VVVKKKNKNMKDSKNKAIEKKKNRRETYAELLERTKGMGWFEAGHEQSRWLNHQKPLSPKNNAKALAKKRREYENMISVAKAYD